MNYHIFNSGSAYWSFKMYLKRNKVSDKHLYLDDDFAFWPLSDFLSDEGKMQRNNWRLKNIHDVYDIFYQPNPDFWVEEEDDYEFKNYKKFEETVKKIKSTDKIYMYINNDANWYLFLGYFYNICENENIFVYIQTWENTLWATHPDKFTDILYKWNILPEIRKNYFKNFFKNISKNELLHIWKNWELKSLAIDFFDRQIIQKYLSKKWENSSKITCNFLCNFKYRDIAFDSFIQNRLLEISQKWFIESKTEIFKIPKLWKNTPAREKKLFFYKKKSNSVEKNKTASLNYFKYLNKTLEKTTKKLKYKNIKLWK